jgi:hypothetical protein
VHSERIIGPNAQDLGFDFYANRGPDGDGEQWLGPSGYFGDPDSGPFEVFINGDQRGKWINATTTRTPVVFLRAPRTEDAPLYAGYQEGSTSELSNSILVP